MGNKAQTILDRIMESVSRDVYDEILSECGDLGEKPTPARQAKYVVLLMDKMKVLFNDEQIKRIMTGCGHTCISNGIIEKAKKIYAGSSDLNDFLAKLNREHIGGGNLYSEGEKIIGVYKTCYCGLAKQAKGLSADYCNCSAGWFEKLFSSVYEKDAKVEKRSTILGGAAECVFEITI